MAFEKYHMPEGSAYSSIMNSKDGWLDPLVVSPRDTHSRSFIILHGRGSNAFLFGLELLTTKLPSSSFTLPELFPCAKFILPTSRLRHSALNQRVKISQWFDIESIINPDQRQELQHEGLHDSATFIHEIIRQEAALVGMENVILGGLSQGCAAGLHVMLSLRCTPGQRLGGFFGMSGWLPFATQLDAIADGKDPAVLEIDGLPQKVDDNLFDRGISHNDVGTSISSQAAHFVRQEVMNFPDTDSDNQNHTSSVPIFLGHGMLDQKVPLSLGRRASTVMAKLGWKVTWKSYADLGHWYCSEELEDIATFVGNSERVCGIK
jgi:predicted esterase